MKPRSSRPTAVTIFILSLPCPPVSHIDYPVGGDTVTRGKPDPEGFLRGPRCSPVHLTIVLVIEASRAAIRVGRSAGCPVHKHKGETQGHVYSFNLKIAQKRRYSVGFAASLHSTAPESTLRLDRGDLTGLTTLNGSMSFGIHDCR
jgi:hypothetical protein